MLEFLGLLAILHLVFGIYCARNMDEVLLPYKMFHIFGKFKSFLFTTFLGSGVIVGLGLGIVMMIFRMTLSIDQIFYALILPGIICTIIAILIYRSVVNKCPKGPLKNRLAWSMIIVGFGSIYRLIFFFINIAVEALEPKKAVDEQSRTIYIFPDNNVYDEIGNWVGKKTDTNKYARIKDD